MATKTKKKGSVAPETKVCANCLAPQAHNGVNLRPCSKCGLADNCGRACQTAHWKAGHKQFCVAPKSARA